MVYSLQWEDYPIPVLCEARNQYERAMDNAYQPPEVRRWALASWRELNTHIAKRVKRVLA